MRKHILYIVPSINYNAYVCIHLTFVKKAFKDTRKIITYNATILLKML